VSVPTAILAEDELLVRRELRELLLQLWPELHILAEAGDGIEALTAFEQFRPDAVFLDIQMPGLTGLDVAAKLSRRAHVVFVTAFDQYAVAAFERGALDYVLKPISAPRLRTTLDRLRSRLHDRPADLSRISEILKEVTASESKYLKWLTVPHGTELRVLAVAEVSYLRADTKYTTVVTPRDTFLVTSSLRQMVEKLDPQVFWQVHRSIVVNVCAIDRIYRSFRGRLEIKLKDRNELLPVSAAHAHLFRRLGQ
jgi:DNA-binding LytR/AlgR family response regulator